MIIREKKSITNREKSGKLRTVGKFGHRFANSENTEETAVSSGVLPFATIYLFSIPIIYT